MSLKDFQVIEKLGDGAYSSVYKVKRIQDEQIYALKKVKLGQLSDKEKFNALNEVRILASIRHPNIVQYKEAFLEDKNLWFYLFSFYSLSSIIMEYADNGDLYQKIVDYQKKSTFMPENHIWTVFIQLVQALKALHDLNIYHRDLKSANVFLNQDGTAKLGDMNVSKHAKKVLLYTQTGTPYYASPEVWKDQPYDSKSDIWSLGCVLYEMTTLKPPFRAEDMAGLYKKVIRGHYPKIPSQYSQDLNMVIRALLQVAPHLRPSCEKILTFGCVVSHMQEKVLVDEEAKYLLQTIKFPKNLHYLTERLPKANYSPLKVQMMDKKNFIQTLIVGREEKQQISSSLPRIGKVHKKQEDDIDQQIREVNQGSQSLKNLLDIHGVRSVDEKSDLIHQIYGKKHVKKVRRVVRQFDQFSLKFKQLVPEMNYPVKTKNKIRMLDIEGEQISLGQKPIRSPEQKDSLPKLPILAQRKQEQEAEDIRKIQQARKKNPSKRLRNGQLL